MATNDDQSPPLLALVLGEAVGSREPVPDRAERPERVGPPAALAAVRDAGVVVEGPGVVVLHDAVQAVAAARRPGCLAGDAGGGLRLAVAELRPDLVPGALHRGAGAAVGGVLAARPAPVEGEAAPGRGGCPGDGVAVGQQVPGDTAHLGGVPARVAGVSSGLLVGAGAGGGGAGHGGQFLSRGPGAGRAARPRGGCQAVRARVAARAMASMASAGSPASMTWQSVYLQIAGVAPWG